MKTYVTNLPKENSVAHKTPGPHQITEKQDILTSYNTINISNNNNNNNDTES